MSTKSPEYRIVRAFGDAFCDKIANRVIRQLQGLTQEDGMQSGQDSVLKNVWDEICVQLQGEESYHWSAYVEVIESFLVPYISQLNSNERNAAWAATSEGWDWFYDQSDTEESPPVAEVDIVSHVSELVLGKGNNWNNIRIRKYLDSSYID